MFSWSHTIADRVAYLTEKPMFNSVLAVMARALMAFIFISAGYSKIEGFSGTEAYMAAMGVNPSFLPAVIALELGGGLALLFGWQTRLTAAGLAGFCVISGLLFHGDGEQANQILLMKNLAMTGAGAPALDRH